MMSIFQRELGSSNGFTGSRVVFTRVSELLVGKCGRVKINDIKIKGWNVEDETWQTLEHLLP